MHNLFNSLQRLTTGSGRSAQFYSLPQLERAGVGHVTRLPVCLRVILESVLRNVDGERIKEEDVRCLANWEANGPRTFEVPFVVSRLLLQDFTGLPLLVDLAAMRSTIARLGLDPAVVEPRAPVDLVIDHSLQIDFSGSDAARLNMGLEMKRNRARYEFLKWGANAFKTLNVIPPGVGICHQVNMEYLAKGVLERDNLYYPDTLVGTDSHTTMINGLGIVGWGVGGIEAEAAMLKLPVYFPAPDVVGVHMRGAPREGVTATDVVLYVTRMLRSAGVVGKFVEFHGEGAAMLPAADRATIANMAPEYGATMGFFPVDEETCRYFAGTGRPPELVGTIRNYFTAQGMFGIPRAGECQYSSLLELDLSEIGPSVAGPNRPQDLIELRSLGTAFAESLRRTPGRRGDGKAEAEAGGRVPLKPRLDRGAADPAPPLELGELGHGAVLVASITSCTNTSNPGVMLAAGLLARKAVERGLTVKSFVKTSLAPGSRAVTHYLEKTGLQPYLDQLGFGLIGYGCTACVGLIGQLDARVEEAVTTHNLHAAAVLSGNRNFEARIHQNIKATFLMSPPLVIAFALAGRVDVDLTAEPLGRGRDGRDVYLRDLWPTLAEVGELMDAAFDPAAYRHLYHDLAVHNPLWDEIPSVRGEVYAWDAASTYIQEPPFFDGFRLEPERVGDVRGARPLAIFGDSITTDHISPAGAISPASPAGQYLRARGEAVEDFNSYGSRRGNHQVMVAGAFSNVRVKNLMTPGVEGGVTVHHPQGERMAIFEASRRYQGAGVPLVIVAGREYGSGSSRDWAAKGTKLLGVKAVIAKSFERIHRSNLVGMGVLPCQFKEGVDAATLRLDGTETFDLIGMADGLQPRQDLTLVIRRAGGEKEEVSVTARIDTQAEADYFRHGGILFYILRQLIART